MAWQWHQREGRLYHNHKPVSRGYSGYQEGKNNPDKQNVKSVGPIPVGYWKIGAPYNSNNVGPFTLPLTAIDCKPNNDIHEPTGRSAFRIHGDSIKKPGTASRGCIILPRIIREQIWASGDHVLQVVP